MAIIANIPARKGSSAHALEAARAPVRLMEAPAPSAELVAFVETLQLDLYAALGIPTVAMPEGFTLEDRADGYHLLRDRDGADLGIMSSPALAACHAAALVRMGCA